MIENFLKKATCRVACGAQSGTGWLIGKHRVVTARHCIIANLEERQPIELFFPDSNGVGVAGKIVGQSEEWDACILSIDATSAAEPMLLSSERPREGEAWQTFGYPQSKATLGHRLSGKIAQALEIPKLKIDLDLSIDTDVALQVYNGMSGAAVVCEGAVVGMIRLKVDGTVAALSLKTLEGFLTDNEVVTPGDSSNPSLPGLAVDHVEVLCLLQPTSNQWSSFGPQIDQSFRSSELPVASQVRTPFETCCRLEPEIVFFDSFTPATPLTFFRDLIGAKDNNFTRQNWRFGRRNKLYGFGQPERAGCSLSVSRNALKIPPGFKLVWIVWLNGNIVTVVDERNNQLL